MPELDVGLPVAGAEGEHAVGPRQLAGREPDEALDRRAEAAASACPVPAIHQRERHAGLRVAAEGELGLVQLERGRA